MRDQCISCMRPGGDPRNGGLCASCAPPLRIVLHGHRTYRQTLTTDEGSSFDER